MRVDRTTRTTVIITAEELVEKLGIPHEGQIVDIGYTGKEDHSLATLRLTLEQEIPNAS